MSPRCNYRCGFCALRTREAQPKWDMDFELYKRVTREMRINHEQTYGPEKCNLREKGVEAAEDSEAGAAYPCWCTPQELEAVRREQEAAKAAGAAPPTDTRLDSDRDALIEQLTIQWNDLEARLSASAGDIQLLLQADQALHALLAAVEMDDARAVLEPPRIKRFQGTAHGEHGRRHIGRKQVIALGGRAAGGAGHDHPSRLRAQAGQKISLPVSS